MSQSITHDIDVRWGDLDALNHVNNTVFLRYLEEARIRFFDEILGDWSTESGGPVVVNINCNFRREIRYPAKVRVQLTARQASEKRLVMDHTITDPENPDVLYADAEITALWMHSGAARSIPLPEVIKAALNAG